MENTAVRINAGINAITDRSLKPEEKSVLHSFFEEKKTFKIPEVTSGIR